MGWNRRPKHSKQELAASRKLRNASDYISDTRLDPRGEDGLTLDILTAAEMKVLDRLGDICSIMDAVTIWNSPACEIDIRPAGRERKG